MPDPIDLPLAYLAHILTGTGITPDHAGAVASGACSSDTAAGAALRAGWCAAGLVLLSDDGEQS